MLTGAGLHIDPMEIELTATNNQSAAGGLVLAKTTNITGFNDIAATAVVSAGAITTSGGKVSEVALVDTLTTYTSNTPQSGDAYARLGAPAGASTAADIAAIKSDTGTILTDVNTGAGAIYTRLGAPAGASMSADIAAINAKTTNLPAQPASVSNITGGTITTVTNLTNAPTSGDFTATMKTSIGTAVAASAVASVTGNVGGNVTGSVGSISGVTFPAHFSLLAIDGGGDVTFNNTVIATVTNLTNAPTAGDLTAAMKTSVSTAVLTTAMTEAYAAKNGTLTVAQALYGLTQQMGEQSITGTTMTVKKRDQATTAKTYTLNDASNPTAITEAS